MDHNRDNLGTGGFAQTGLHINLVAAADSNVAGEITFNSPSVTRPCPGEVAQRRILLRDGGTHANPLVFGQTTGGPGRPWQITECVINTDNIDQWVQANWPNQLDWPMMYTAELTHMITHELSHAVNMAHHNGNPNSGPFDYLCYATPGPGGSLAAGLHNFYCTGQGDPAEIRTQMDLQ